MTPTTHKDLQARIDRLAGNKKPRDSTTCRNAHWKDLRDYGLFSDAPDVQEKRTAYEESLSVIVFHDAPEGKKKACLFSALNATPIQRARAFVEAFETKETT